MEDGCHGLRWRKKLLPPGVGTVTEISVALV
jgi:hypothetical protein